MPCCVDLGDDREDLLHDHRRETHRRLVEQEHARARHQRAADREHLLLAARHRAARLGAPFAKAREQLEDTLEVRLVGRGLAVASRVGAHVEVLDHGHAREDAATFGRLADAELDALVRRHRGDVVAVEHDQPDVTGRTPEIAFSVVVLPAPFAPMSVTISPSSTSKEMPLIASMRP